VNDTVADLLERTIMASLPVDRKPTEAELHERAEALRKAFPVPDEVFGAVVRAIEARLVISMDMGTVLFKPDHVPWLMARKAEIDPFYFERYRQYLPKLGMTPAVIGTLDRVTDEILDMCGNPMLAGQWSRRGLVVGDVQSGKTATYTALTCKAADAGCRLIVLMTGTLENLRRQTQQRLDEGFVGLDSSDKLQKAQIAKNNAVGVGVIDNRRVAGVFTSRSRDFSKVFLNSLGFRLDAFQEPVLLVIKKNARIIENLHNWLEAYNSGPDGKIAAPLLLIDDEADSASINTADPSGDPTAINARVRKLLSLFHRSTYVGFTATPFANVFVDPDTEDDMLGDDLFPRDFIYALEAPSNYIGAQVVFSDELPGVLPNDDAIDSYPPKHKSTHIPEDLPPSLSDAVRSFFLACSIRDLRGERDAHRSMLVNVSRFTAVQNATRDLIYDYAATLQRDIRNFSQLPTADAMLNGSLIDLKATWEEQFKDVGTTWDELRHQLHESTSPIAVRSVNQSSPAASLDYTSYGSAGLRVIAVGGDSLSRGLTLEGLSTSYFYRSAQAYDTLMQMGRWFGYRDGYADLCRVWLTDEAVHWYSHISMASDELRAEFKRMWSLNLTPKDFGLKVRSHPDSLTVTARNKMRFSEDFVREISLSANGIETARLLASEAQLDANAQRVEAFVGRMETSGYHVENSEWGSKIWRGVPKALVATILAEFETHPRAVDFQGKAIARFLQATKVPALDLWDVALPQGSGDPEVFAGIEFKPPKRSIAAKPGDSSLLVSGAKARVGSRGVEREGMSKPEVQAIEEANPGPNVSDKQYRLGRRRPLLLLHVLRGTTGEEKTPFRPAPAAPLTALGLSFPAFDDSGIAGRVEYKVTMRFWKELFDVEASDEIAGVDDAD
jgi:hypothetical protein